MSSQTYSKKTALLGIVVILVVIAVAWQGLNRKKQQDYLTQLREDAIKDADVLKDFPSNLVLDQQARKTYGDVRDTREGQLWRQGYESQLPGVDLAKRYREYLAQESWIKLLDTTTPQGEIVMNFLKDQSRLGVTITPAAAGSKLNLDYYKRLKIFDQGQP